MSPSEPPLAARDLPSGLASLLPSMDDFLAEWMPKWGALARDGLAGGPPAAWMKSPGQVVTEIDTRIERSVIEQIRARWPEHGIVGEESGRHAGSAQPSDLTWWIDPIDGTMNFVRGIPMFAVSIAVIAAGRPVLGHVYDPMHDEHFRARAGAGAWRNGTRLRISDASSLAAANVHMEVTRDDDFLARPSFLPTLHRACLKTRKLGVMSIEMAYVAAGRADLLLAGKEDPLSWWDIGAGWALVEEAGGVVRDLEGRAVTHETRALLAGRDALVDELSALLIAAR